MNSQQIGQYLNIGLIVLFVLIILGLAIALFRGFMRGVWKSTHNMIFMMTLIFIAFFTLDSLTNFVGSFPLSNIVHGSFYISRTIDGEVVTYYVPITNVKDTLTEFIQGFYTIYNVSASSSSAADFAIALSTSVLKVVIFIVDMILIVTLGNLASLLGWYLIFRHFVPKIAQKTVKIRWLGMIETGLTFVVVTFLFMTPFTSLVNSFNQSYQKSKPEANSEIAKNVGDFVNTYNNSLFAKVFFNWTVDSSGMTFDTRLFNTLTQGRSGEYTIGMVGELANITNVVASASTAIASEGTEITIDTTALVTQQIVDQAFETIINSPMINSILPVVVEVALNSDLLVDFVPDRLVDLSDVKWNEELGYVRDMVDCVFESGVVDSLFTYDEAGKRIMRPMKDTDLYNFIEEVVYTENFDSLLNVFKSIDQSKVLSRAVPALLQYLINNDTSGTAKQYLPFTWEELNELSWGYESYVLLDFLHATAELDSNFVKAIFIQTGAYPADPEVKSLTTLISEHAREFKELMVGKFNGSGELINVDKYGHTIVLDSNGKRIKDGDVARHFCLFDMNLVDKVFPTILDNLFDSEAFSQMRTNISDDDLIPFHQAVADLNDGVRIKNYKKEFDAVLDVVVSLADDQELLDALFTGKGLTPLMQEENNFFSIDESHINYFKTAVGKMDNSTLIYSTLAPILKSSLLLEDVKKTFESIGLKSEVVADAIEKDIQKDKNSHQLFSEFSSLLDRWPDLKNIYSLAGLTDTNAMMDKLKDQTIINSLVNILDELHDNSIINPQYDGATFEKNENLYSMLEFVFEMADGLGLDINRNLMRQVETPTHSWHQEFLALGEVLHFVASRDLMNASSAFENGLTRTAIDHLRGNGEGDYDIPGLFTRVNASTLFSKSFGPFLDDMFGDALTGFLIDQEKGITFNNITDWEVEGQNMKDLLDSLYNITPIDDAEAQDFLSNFEISKFDDVVSLNSMLHDLANSGIFTYIDNEGEHYQFNKWLYSKLESSLGNLELEGGPYDLLEDPTFEADSVDEWKVSWGNRPEDSGTTEPEFVEWHNEYDPNNDKPHKHYLAYRDFVHDYSQEVGGDIRSFWCDYDNFQIKQKAFLQAHEGDLTTTYTTNEWGAYFASETFMNDYEAVFEVDEISRIVKFLTYSLMLVKEKADHSTLALDSLPASLLKNLLESLNETHCMRMSIYNFYRIASDSVSSSISVMSFSSAYISYMVDADQSSIYDFDGARPLRSAEFDKLLPLYEFINYSNDHGLIDDSGNFKYESANDYDTDPNGFMRHFEDALLAMNKSLVFHLKGSSKLNKLTVLQDLFRFLLNENGTVNTLYLGDNSPKDVIATNYHDAESKVEYLLINVYNTVETVIENARREQEIHYLVYSFNELYSLTDAVGTPVTSIEAADLTGPYGTTNRETLNTLLLNLNQSDLLCDLVPNSIYNIFIINPAFSITGGSEPVDFSRVDPFYHYFYNPDTLVKRVDYSARYSNADINSLNQVLSDYQQFNADAGSSDWSNKEALLNMIGTDGGNFTGTGALPQLLKSMHASHLFHTPARNYGSGYYTNKFNNGYTLFENIMSIVCSSIGLDTFAYDSTYDSVQGFSNASQKLYFNIKQLTAADDGELTNLVYHATANEAWEDEIDALMHLAYSAANISSGTNINVDSFEMDALTPAQVKELLTDINYSNLVCDAVPNFIEDGFSAINLADLTTYNAANYANYRLGQVVYGGSNGLSGDDTEIDNIYLILNSLRDGDAYITDFSDINDFISTDTTGARLTGLLRYVYESQILNTPVDQAYGSYYIQDGYRISAQGVLLYNIFESSGLIDFVARDAYISTPASSDYEKIQQLSLIVHMPYDDADAISAGLTYEIESQGLKRLIQTTDTYGITADSFTGMGNEDIANVKNNYETPLLTIINIAYDADNHGHRSALVSEFVGGLLNNILENEYDNLNDKVNNNGYAYLIYTFGKPYDASLIQFSHYSSINAVEKNGLQGILDCLDYVDQLSDPVTLATMDAAQRQAIADGIEACFALATTDVGGQLYNSELARIIYLNDVHPIFKAFAGIQNANHQTFANDLVDETSTSSNPGTKTVYSSGFYFSSYGTAFKNYIYPGFY